MVTEYVTRFSNFTERVDEHHRVTVNGFQKRLQHLQLEIDNKEIAVARLRPKAHFYLNMQRKLIPQKGYAPPDPEIVAAWQNFIMMIKLTLDETVKGLTQE